MNGNGVRAHVRSIWKQGNAAEEYEDASAFDCVSGRFAVADGASDAYDSGRWARLLVESFAAGELPLTKRVELERWVDGLAPRWNAEIPWDELSEPRHWYKHEKAMLGDFATFLGLQLELRHRRGTEQPRVAASRDLGRRRMWRALAVGDACLFHIRAGKVMPPTSFPVSSRADFGVTPPLIGTDKRYNRRSLKAARMVEGSWEPGDVFLLATDALAHCIFAAWEAGDQSLSRLSVLTDVEFGELVTRLRRSNRMRNDDVTLLVVEIEPATQSPTETPRSDAASPIAVSARGPKVSAPMVHDARSTPTADASVRPEARHIPTLSAREMTRRTS